MDGAKRIQATHPANEIYIHSIRETRKGKAGKSNLATARVMSIAGVAIQGRSWDRRLLASCAVDLVGGLVGCFCGCFLGLPLILSAYVSPHTSRPTDFRAEDVVVNVVNDGFDLVLH